MTRNDITAPAASTNLDGMRRSFAQLVRYGLVGVGLNLGGYLLYLGATSAGAGHKSAMTALYVLGTLLSFVLNKRWSFGHRGSSSRPLARHLVAYGLGYVASWLGLYVFVDVVGWPHEAVQFALIFAVAAMLFLLQKFWVFRSAT